MAREKWKPVVDWDGMYEVSDMGRVRSVARVVPHATSGTLTIKQREMKQGANGRGYKQVWLCRGGEYTPKLVHRLVLEAFIGPCPDGMECCHGNGERRDNRLSNLRWDTRSANQLDKDQHGTSRRGEQSSLAKLTQRQVNEIRYRYKKGCRANGGRALASEYGVSDSQISRIVAGKRWSWPVAMENDYP